MARRSPIVHLHEQGEGLLIPYGPESAGVYLVGAFDPVEIEYAAIRRGCGIFDQPHRAVIGVGGSERLEFLNRMLTQELSPSKAADKGGFGVHSARNAFWLNRKGRIDADLRVINLPERVLLDVDVHALERTMAGLSSFIITEDVALTDLSADQHRLGVHGPASAALLARVSTPRHGPPVAELRPGQVCEVTIAGEQVLADRRDITGEIGVELCVRAEGVERVYEALSTSWESRNGGPAAPTTDLARRIGWHALNIARIEAGTPMYYADYGPDSLPHETGVLHDRVSFTKGCYLGQEVVARMESLGHPKQRLVRLKPEVAAAQSRLQAETGTPVVSAESAEVVGAVTSSCVSPLLGMQMVCFAMMKWSHSGPGTRVLLRVGDESVAAVVQDQLVAVAR